MIDASVVVDFLVGPDLALERELPDDPWHAPALLDIEVVHALRVSCSVTTSAAHEPWMHFTITTITRWPLDDTFRRRCLQLAHNLTAYDAGYVALAEGLDCSMVTRDRGLATNAARYVHADLV